MLPFWISIGALSLVQGALGGGTGRRVVSERSAGCAAVAGR